MARTVLIVDDDRALVRGFEELIGRAEYRVLTAHDGAEALLKIKDQLPDIVVLDVQMPGVHGYSFLFELRKIEGGGNVPVIVLTAHEDMKGVFMAEGVQEYCLKPCSAQVILEKIRKYIR